MDEIKKNGVMLKSISIQLKQHILHNNLHCFNMWLDSRETFSFSALTISQIVPVSLFL